MAQRQAAGRQMQEPQRGETSGSVPAVSRTGLLTLALLLLTTVVTLLICRHATGGRLIYALDDAYIHLAMARTLAEHGVLGVNAETPAAASSSPLWTALLAGLARVMGSHEWQPLILNVLAAAALVLLTDYVLREQFEMRARWRFITLLVMGAIGPLVPIMMTGMEHALHVLAVLALVWYSLRSERPSLAGLFALGFLAVGVRYESAFVIAVLAMVLLIRRRWRSAVALIAGGVTLVVGVGLYQMQMGQHFLPNSLLAKAVPGGGVRKVFEENVSEAVANAQGAQLAVMVVVCFVAATFAAFRQTFTRETPTPRNRTGMAWTAVFLGAALMHWGLADLGWFNRYEAYLVMVGTLLTSSLLMAAFGDGGVAAFRRSSPQTYREIWALALVLAVLATGLTYYPRLAQYSAVRKACLNIYEQQYQMARFVSRYHEHEPIVINDIGYVAYLSSVPLVDLWGLATVEVTDVMRNEGRTQEFVAELAEERGASIAILYEWDFTPDAWIRVASWQVDQQTVVHDDTVHFYAVEPGVAHELRANLREFEAALPAGVTVSYKAEEGVSG